ARRYRVSFPTRRSSDLEKASRHNDFPLGSRFEEPETRRCPLMRTPPERLRQSDLGGLTHGQIHGDGAGGRATAAACIQLDAGLRRGCDDESLAGAGAHGSESAAAPTVVVRDEHVGRVWVVDVDCVDGARLAVHFDGAGAAGDEWNGEPYAGPAQKSDAHRI